MKTSKQLIDYRNRILATPKHLREFEETCWLRTAYYKIEQALAAERHAAAQIEKTRLEAGAFKALVATAEYARGVESRKSLVAAVSEMYLLLTKAVR